MIIILTAARFQHGINTTLLPLVCYQDCDLVQEQKAQFQQRSEIDEAKVRHWAMNLIDFILLPPQSNHDSQISSLFSFARLMAVFRRVQ